MREILAPAGTMECAKAAVAHGANAIYLGLNAFSARQNAGNFDEAAFCNIVKYAHSCAVKVYVAMNTAIKDEELSAFEEQILCAWSKGADAIILQDILLGKALHEKYPQIILYLSTQAGVCNLSGAEFAKECGFSRVILARETAYADICEIAKFIETEVFVQGALCTCFSGQCYLSSFAGGNSGNRGRCKQPCRKQYRWNRTGYEEKAYALSLSDLCVGEEIQKYLDAGVLSFKIEGRMRRPEYVASAVAYYRAILDGEPKETRLNALSDLKRTYNRGNYTSGLSFGQEKRFLSRAVQGHIGEKVGVVKVVNGKYFVETKFLAQKGDAFKILRAGKEVGGANFERSEKRGFILLSKTRLLNGDGVFITTDTALTERLLDKKKFVQIPLSITLKTGERAVAQSGNLVVFSEEILEASQSRPLTEGEIVDCFLKTDGLPFTPVFENIRIDGDIFFAKSRLNAFRRAFYQALEDSFLTQRELPLKLPFSYRESNAGNNEKLAVIASDFSNVVADVAIYKPDNYRNPLPENFLKGNFEKYLYYPAYLTGQDQKLLADRLQDIDGIYAENYGGLSFAKRYGVKVFAGTGFNLTNTVSISEIEKREEVSYYVLSKELERESLLGFRSEKAFALSSGNLKVMDLLYCPFEKTCAKCDKRQKYILTDENNREFPARRYELLSGCKFELYNCADLIGEPVSGLGALLDLTLIEEKKLAIEIRTSCEKQKKFYPKYTFGHTKNNPFL